MKFLITLTLAFAVGPIGCTTPSSTSPMTAQDATRAMERYNAAITSGTHGEAYPGQFNQLYPNCVNFISYYSGQIGTPSWTSTAGLYQRYLLTMQVPIRLNAARTKVVAADNPKFYLDEFLSVTPGKVTVTFGANGQISTSGRNRIATFEAGQWSRLFKSRGDFGALGITLETNKPVQGFETSWRKF
jgi:hypothetical protein